MPHEIELLEKFRGNHALLDDLRADLMSLLKEAAENLNGCRQAYEELKHGLAQRYFCMELHRLKAPRFRARVADIQGKWQRPVSARLAAFDRLKLSPDDAEVKNEHLGSGLANIEIFRDSWETICVVLEKFHGDVCKKAGDWALAKAQLERVIRHQEIDTAEGKQPPEPDGPKTPRELIDGYKRREGNISYEEIATRASITKRTLLQIRDEHIKNPNTETLKSIAATIGCDAPELLPRSPA